MLRALRLTVSSTWRIFPDGRKAGGRDIPRMEAEVVYCSSHDPLQRGLARGLGVGFSCRGQCRAQRLGG